MLRRLAVVSLVGLFVFASSSVYASPVTVDFEGFPDGSGVGAGIPGLTFTNAMVLEAGVSLNEFDFPPRSGSKVATDDGGPILIDFASPVSNVGGHFNYAVPLLLEAFDASNASLGITSSGFSANFVSGADPGSAPNESLLLAFAGISRVSITGDSAGGSFTLDDLTYEPATTTTPVPEPATWLLLASGLVAAGFRRRRSVHA